MTLALVSGGLLLSLFARELTTVIAPRYDRAYLVVGVLSTGVVLFAIANIASSGIALARRTKYIAAYTAIATLLNVALNLLLIPAWGMIGAATATAAAYALLAVLYYRKAQQLYPTPFLTRRTLTALLVGCPLMAIGALPIEPEGLAVAIKLLTIALFVLAIWRLRLLDDEEFHALLSLARRTRSQATVPTQTRAGGSSLCQQSEQRPIASAHAGRVGRPTAAQSETALAPPGTVTYPVDTHESGMVLGAKIRAFGGHWG